MLKMKSLAKKVYEECVSALLEDTIAKIYVSIKFRDVQKKFPKY
jgi:hypothetical protein